MEKNGRCAAFSLSELSALCRYVRVLRPLAAAERQERSD
jgi:hypothetical protein